MTHPTAKASQLIDCSVGDAFDAFVDPAKITRFWLDSTSGPLAPDATVTWHFMVPGAVETTTVDAFEADALIGFRWSDGNTVRLAFAEHAAGQTRVSAEVRGFTGQDIVGQAINATEGFSIVLCDLKTFLESGRSAHLVRSKAALIAATINATD